MRVRMLTLAAGPMGVFPPGSVREVSESDAAALIGGGFAVPVDVPRTAAPIVETATVAPTETASTRAPGPARGRRER